jgi:hypothetical protein
MSADTATTEPDSPALPSALPSALPRWSLALAFITSTIGLILTGAAGSRSRFVADDYWFELAVRERGFWRVQIEFYRGWSGRMSAAFLQSGLKALGPWTAGAFPSVILLIWVTGAWFAAHQIGRPHKLSRLAELALGSSFVAACVFAMPNMFQSLFWQSGSPSYAVPQALLPWTVGLVCGKRFAVLRHCVAAFLMFFVVTSSEPSALTYLGSVCALAFFCRPHWKRFAGPFLGALIGFVAIAGAPGNNARRTALFVKRSALDNLSLAVGQWGMMVSNLVTKHPWSLAGAIAIGLAASQLVRDSLQISLPIRLLKRRTYWLMGTLMFLIPLASFVTSAFLTGALVPVRVHPILLSPILFAAALGAFGLSTPGQTSKTVAATTKPTTRPEPKQRSTPRVAALPAVGLALFSVIGSSLRIPAEFAGGASLKALNESIDRQLQTKGPKKIEVPNFVGGVFFVSPLDLDNPDSYWTKRFQKADAEMVTLPTGIWGPTVCESC